MNKKLSSITSAVLMILLVMVSGVAFAQKVKKLEFRYVEQKEGSLTKTVVFTIVGNTSDLSTASLLKAIVGIKEVHSFKIFYNRRCKVE
ncbi:MAG: hypothetical protein V2A54_10060, partial [Bacteroidota bacterium]